MSTYALVQDGTVINLIEWDGDESTWAPDDGQSAISIADGDVAHIGLGYADGVFVQPVVSPPSPVDVLASNTTTRDALLTQASVAISPLQMAVSLGEATDAETTLAKEWVAYSRGVKAVDLTQMTPAWPSQPD